MFKVSTYCTVVGEQTKTPRESEYSLIWIEECPKVDKLDPCDNGVKVIGEQPIIPIGDTGVGYDTTTDKVVYLGEINRLRLNTKLKKDEKVSRLFTIDSVSSVHARIKHESICAEFGFDERWERVYKPRSARILTTAGETLPLTKTGKADRKASKTIKCCPDTSAELKELSLSTSKESDVVKWLDATEVASISTTACRGTKTKREIRL